MLLASVVHAGMADTERWPRGGRFYRPPAATHLSLSPNGLFQPPQWPTSVDHGGHWLGLDVASTGTAGGVTRNATGARRERWYAREVSVYALCFGSPTPAPTLLCTLMMSNHTVLYPDLHTYSCTVSPFLEHRTYCSIRVLRLVPYTERGCARK